MVNKQYYERVVKYHNITPRKYKNALTGKSGGGFWYQVGGGIPYFMWGYVIGTLIGCYIIFKICYWVLSAFLSGVFGCAPDNPVLAAFLTLTLAIWVLKGAVFGFKD